MHLFRWELPAHTLALLGLTWYCFVVFVICIGSYQLYAIRFTHYLRPTPTPVSSRLPLVQVPHVTIIRPIVGMEALWEECLASTFQQNYPASKLTIYFCVETKDDPAYPVLEKLVAEHPSFDARIFVESEDPNLHGPKGSLTHLGPNPKIRNMSAAYREAKGDLMWIVDANVWVSASACGLMVDKLCGLGGQHKHKFVHQLPLVVDVSAQVPQDPKQQRVLGDVGAALDELFLGTAHAKFYTAINTVAIAPCSVGKSTMFRRHHLAALTPARRAGRSPGIDFFSDNICEDHLIGDLLWKRRIPVAVQQEAAKEGMPPPPAMEPEASPSRKRLQRLHEAAPVWSNHGALIAPPCVQPVAHATLGAYVARRVRWLRVRKFTVPAATAVEPGTESLVATACLATGATNVPGLRDALRLGSSWSVWLAVFAVGLAAWAALDFAIWRMLQGWAGEDAGQQGSGWPAAVREQAARPARVLAGRAGPRKSAWWWARHWLGRELLALPVWAAAVLGGTTISWRGRRFRVSMDAKVRALDTDGGGGSSGGSRLREKENKKRR